MSIVMTGGGTGGHLAIIRAVKEQLVLSGTSEPAEIVYIGSTKGQDRQWFREDEDFSAKYFLETVGVVNQGVLGKVRSLWKMIKAYREARQLLQEHRATVVFSVGGFSAAATAFAAKSLHIPLVIHEQNAALGSLNKILKPYATEFISSYLDESPIKAYPVKQEFFDKARVRNHVKTIIFIGGSQGAVAINTLALTLAPKLKEQGITIIHQAGERNIDEVRKAYEVLGVEAEVFGFTDRLAAQMQKADFAIARAGASTLWELAATALPTLFIPYPYAAGDHQYHNAKFLVEQDLAWMMREDEIDETKVLGLLDEDLERRSRGLMETVEREGSEKIAELLRRF